MNRFYRYVLFVLFVLISINYINAQPFDYPMKVEATPFGCGLLEGGYASKFSAYQGDSISFYVSTHANPFTLKIYRYGKYKEQVAELSGLPGGIKEVKESDKAYVNGCGWSPALNFKIPSNWRAGAYLAEFPTENDSINPILFFVKEKDASKRSKVVVACAITTYQAYNMFGGKSVYPAYSSPSFGSEGVNYSVKLSFNRPFNMNNHNGINRGSFYSYDAKLIRWLEDYGYGKDVDVVGSAELESDPAYLNSHKVLLTCGHDEYWSRGMRENVQAFVNQGGNFMCLSGNTCWWQIRFENNYRTFICYKHASGFDPIPDRRLETKEWYLVERENPVFGTSYENGGQTNYYYMDKNGPIWPGCLTYKNGYGGYIVHNSQNWIYKNSGLQDGDTLGLRGDSSIVGYESDAALFGWVNGLPVPTGKDQTPLNYRILGLSPTSDHTSANVPAQWATMGIFKYPKDNSGLVFNAATIRWVWGFYSNESRVSQITKNVLDHFLEDRYPPEIVSWSPSIVKNEKRFNLSWSVNSRNKELQYGKNLMLRIEAKGYNNETVKYAWAINDSIIPEAKNSSFIFSSLKYPFGTNKITAFAYNTNDSSSISWNIKSTVGSGFAIASIPDTVMRIGQLYKYTLSHYSKLGNVVVKYTPNYLPKWAKYYPDKNTIEGIPDCIKDSVSITAADNFGNSDTQEFTIRNLETTFVKNDKVITDYRLYQNYPNPFNGATRIRFDLKDQSRTELTIADVLGKKIRSYSLGQIPSGYHEVTWDGRDDFGNQVSSGIYFYIVSFDSENSGIFKLSKKMIYMK